MKATVPFELERARTALPETVLAEMRRFRSRLALQSQIVWGEHCSECAYPACYSQCSYYTPKYDLNCRRFDRGIESVTAPDGIELVQIQFRRWGKLEGEGPARLRPLTEAARRLTSDARMQSVVSLPVLPRRVSSGLAHRWNSQKSKLPQPARLQQRASHFVLETWLDPELHAAPIAFTLTIADKAKLSDTLFQHRLDVVPGYARLVLPVTDIARLVDLETAFLVQIEPVGDAPPVPIIFGLTEFAAAAPGEALAPFPAAPKKAKTAKCVVWDLDDTLWHGTLAEDGIEGLRLRPEAVSLLKQLDARGILQSVASKNDADIAIAALQHFGLRDYFLFPQIGWGPKSVSVRQLAELLDIGTDTFVFLDDQPFERAEVKQSVPDVTVIDAADVPDLAAHALFDVPVTAESGKRRAMYQTEETRQATFQSSGADYLDFLRDCQLELEIDTLNAGNLERIYELTQRTNQLNFSGTRYDRAELKAMTGVPGRTHVLRCSDKFGDYGIIGFVVTDPAGAEIESFFMSCRVQRKRVEHALFAYLDQIWGEPAEIRARYRPTEKNAASVRLLESLGFRQAGGSFLRARTQAFPESDIVRLRLSSAAGAVPS